MIFKRERRAEKEIPTAARLSCRLAECVPFSMARLHVGRQPSQNPRAARRVCATSVPRCDEDRRVLRVSFPFAEFAPRFVSLDFLTEPFATARTLNQIGHTAFDPSYVQSRTRAKAIYKGPPILGRSFVVPKPRFRAFTDYLVDWRNAIRFLWHVFTVRAKPRRAVPPFGAANHLTRSLAKDRD